MAARAVLLKDALTFFGELIVRLRTSLGIMTGRGLAGLMLCGTGKRSAR